MAALLVATLAALSARADAGGGTPLSPEVDRQVDAMVRATVSAVQRIYGKSAAFCTDHGLPSDGSSLKARLDDALSSTAAGSREAFLEIANADVAYFRNMLVPGEQELAKADSVGDQLLKGAMASPVKACAAYTSYLQSHSKQADVKAVVMKQYLADEDRRARCAASPRPADCP